MSRLVKKDAQGPFEVKPAEKSVWICQCGLSQNGVFCDGSHKKTKDETEGKIFKYLPDGTRTEVAGA